MSAALCLHIPGRGSVSLAPENFLARGGEATLYALGDRVYKIWHDPARCPPASRVSALCALQSPAAVLPCGLAFDGDGRLRGTVQPYLADAEPWARLCTPAYQQRHGLDAAAIALRVARLRDGVAALHSEGVLLVDLSDTNVLVSPTGAVHLIDSEAWGIGPYQPRAYTAAVADPTRDIGDVDTGTDWFSFAVLAYSALLGVHPYGGTHPTVKGLAARMAAGISVFDRAVTTPPSAGSPSDLPPAWQHWFEGVFVRGERCEPPDTPSTPARPRPRPAEGVRLSAVCRLDGPARGWVCSGAHWAAWTGTGVWRDAQRVADAQPALLGVALSPGGALVLVSRRDGRLRLQTVDGREVPVLLRADAVCVTPDGRILVRAGDRLVEVSLHDGAGLLASAQEVGRVLPAATELSPGAALQDVHGHAWLSLFAAPGRATQVRLAALDGQRGVTVLAAGSAAALASPHGVPFLLRTDARHTTEEVLSAPVRSLIRQGALLVVHTLDDQLTLLPADPSSDRRRTVTAHLPGPLLAGPDAVYTLDGDRVLRATLT